MTETKSRTARKQISRLRHQRRRRMLETLEPRCLLASLGGQVFLDANSDSVRGAEEPGAADVRVFLDTDRNGRFDVGEISTTTDSSGAYRFNNLTAGSYAVRTTADAQTTPRSFYGTGDFDDVAGGPTQLFELSDAGVVSPIGVPTTQSFDDIVRTSTGVYIGINDATDSLYSVDRVSGTETLLAVSTNDLVGGLAYDPASDTIYTLVRRDDALELASIDPTTGDVTLASDGSFDLLTANFGSTFFDFDTVSQTATPRPRQFLSPFSSTLDERSDGAIFGLQGNDLNRFDFVGVDYTFERLGTLSGSIEAISFDGRDQLFGIDATGSTLHTIDVGSLQVDAGTAITFEGNPISGLTGFDIAPDGTHFLIDSTHLYTLDPVTGVATRAANRVLPNRTVTSLSVGINGQVFATVFDVATPVVQIDPETGLGTTLGDSPDGGPYSAIIAGGTAPPLSGFGDVVDLAFDPIARRIVGFDDSTDRFFQFTTNGIGSPLATAQRPLNSTTLAFDGQSFVMFDDDDSERDGVITVNPDDGSIAPVFDTSLPVSADSLHFATTGNAAQFVTLADADDATGFDFGLTSIPPRESVLTDFPSVISELLIDPLFGDRNTDQLVELRGVPGGRLAANTYLVVVDEENMRQGQIRQIFDLSNQSFGENGYLVISQAGSPHAINPQSAVLQATTDGFAGLPGDLFSTIETMGNRIGGLLSGFNGFFLIESNVPPQIGEDIDVDDDGVADDGGLLSQWRVLDSVSLHPSLGTADQAYAQILLNERTPTATQAVPRVPPGAPILLANGTGYVARIGESVGSSADDWITGTANESATDRSGDLLELFSFGPHLPAPLAFLERQLDHFGEANFNGGVRGTVSISTALGGNDPDNLQQPMPATDVMVLVDENGNGMRDLRSFSADPDIIVAEIIGNTPVFPRPPLPEIPLTHAFPGVTLSTAGNDNEPISFEIRADRETNGFVSSNNFLYTHAGVNFFNEGRKFRADFLNPAREVSIVAIGPRNGPEPHYARLEAYDANNVLIGSVVSQPLLGSSRQTLSIASTGDDIAYAIAFGDETTQAVASPFGRLDNFSYVQSEFAAVTDEQGQYEIKNLFPGQYDIVIANGPDDSLLGIQPTRIEVIRNENFVVSSLVRPNTPPIVAPEFAFTTPENAAVGTVLGIVEAMDPDGQPLNLQILGENEFGLILNSTTGELTVGPSTTLDFETSPQIQLDVSVSDPLTSSMATVTITLSDINEGPIVQPTIFVVAEGTAAGTSLGQIIAVDPDSNQSQGIRFAIVGGPNSDAFDINPTTGLVTLVDAAAIDFEENSELRFTVRVSDDADPVASTEFVQIIEVLDQNDPPAVATTEIQLAENPLATVVGQLRASDPDVSQTHTFELLGGTGADLFRVRRNGMVEVRDGATIDFEQGSVYTLRVRTIDSGAPPLAAEAVVTVTIIDVDELPTLTLSSATIAENSPAGTLVATLEAIDPDGDEVNTTLTLLNAGDSANYDFDPGTGQLTVAEGAILDFESTPKQTIRIRVQTTNPSTSNDVNFDVVLSDANDAPIITTERVVLSESAAPGTIVGRVEIQVFDPDNNDVVSLDIIGGTAAPRLSLDSSTGILRVAPGATFDFESDVQPLSLEVQVTDSAGSSNSRVVEIILNDVNESPFFTASAPPSSTIESGTFYELVIPSEAAVDPEGRNFSYAVFGVGESLPPWLTFNPTTRRLSGVARPVDVGTYQLALRAFEPGPLDLRSDQPFTLTVVAGDSPLTNKRNPLDVDGNNVVTPLDALRIINYVNRFGSGSSAGQDLGFFGFVDTSGDGIVTALDALLVVNGLQTPPAASLTAASMDFATDDDERATDEALGELLSEASLF